VPVLDADGRSATDGRASAGKLDQAPAFRLWHSYHLEHGRLAVEMPPGVVEFQQQAPRRQQQDVETAQGRVKSWSCRLESWRQWWLEEGRD
jgi:hypothetical protein